LRGFEICQSWGSVKRRGALLQPRRECAAWHARHTTPPLGLLRSVLSPPTHLQREVDVAGCINDVDGVVVPVAGGGGGGDGDAALLLLHHPVHGGRALVHLADLVGAAGVVQDALSGGGLHGGVGAVCGWMGGWARCAECVRMLQAGRCIACVLQGHTGCAHGSMEGSPAATRARAERVRSAYRAAARCCCW